MFGLWGLVLSAAMAAAQPIPMPSAGKIIAGLERDDNQSVLSGWIDSYNLTRGPASFHLGPGEMRLFDFGSGRIAGMVYRGEGTFSYIPPDKAEAHQLRRFAGVDTLRAGFEKLTIFFTADLGHFSDTASFLRTPVEPKAWDQLAEAADDIFEHMHINMTNELLSDLLVEGPGRYLCAYFELDGEQMAFFEDPSRDDLYALYNFVIYKKHIEDDDDDVSNDQFISEPFANQWGGCSPDAGLPSERGIAPIDITRYDIQSRIGGNGDMPVRCVIHYTVLRPGRRHVNFTWYDKNNPVSAVDGAGRELLIVHRKDEGGLTSRRKDEYGFGIVLDEPLEAGREDSLAIQYDCKSLRNIYGIYYPVEIGSWYPQNPIRDVATYSITYDCDDYFRVVCGGRLAETKTEDGRTVSRWMYDDPINYTTFAIGKFESKEFTAAGAPTVEAFILKDAPHTELAIELSAAGIVSSGDMLGMVGNDVANSLAFYTSILGPCPFDTVRAVELLLWGPGQSSPGLVHLSWSTFQYDDIAGYDESYRAHETAHQWWGHTIDYESYRDTWIGEGLAEYCGIWYFQLTSQDKKAFEYMMSRKRERIISGADVRSVGSKAGPVVMGQRLISSKTDDYTPVVYYKGGYIFHMIRYLLHDYKTGSDDAFAAFLKDLALKYKDKIITTEGLRELLKDHVGGDMGWFFDQWVYGTEIPRYTFHSEWSKTLDEKYRVTCHVRQDKVPEGFKMLVPLTVLFDDEKYIHFKVWVDKPETEIELPPLPYKPKKIIFNTYDAVLCGVEYR
jgi:hypothetical protein